MTLQRYEKIADELETIENYVSEKSKPYGGFFYDDKFFYIYRKPIEDTDWDGNIIWEGVAFCLDNMEICEYFEDEIEYRIPSYDFTRNRRGEITYCGDEIFYTWYDSYIGWKDKKVC